MTTMSMNGNQKGKQYLLKILREEIPDRDICKIITREELQILSSRIDFETIQDFLMEKEFELTSEEIGDLWFELVLFLRMFQECWEAAYVAWDSDVFDFMDSETVERIEYIKAKLEFNDDFCFLRYESLIEFAKSEEPNF